VIFLDCHVELRGDKIARLAGLVPYRSNRETIPERRPIALVIEQIKFDRLLGQDSFPYRVNIARIRIGPLHKSAITADDVGRRKASQFFESGIDVNDRIVRQSRVANCHGGAGDTEGSKKGSRSLRRRAKAAAASRLSDKAKDVWEEMEAFSITAAIVYRKDRGHLPRHISRSAYLKTRFDHIREWR